MRLSEREWLLMASVMLISLALACRSSNSRDVRSQASPNGVLVERGGLGTQELLSLSSVGGLYAEVPSERLEDQAAFIESLEHRLRDLELGLAVEAARSCRQDTERRLAEQQLAAAELSDELASSRELVRSLTRQVRALELERDQLLEAESQLVSEDIQPIGETIENLPEGQVAFIVPESLKLGAVGTATLHLSLVEGFEALLTEVELDGMEVDELVVELGDLVIAQLNGSEGLAVLSHTASGERVLTSTSPQEWIWEVRAVEPGEQRLYLALSVVLPWNGGDRLHQVMVVERVVDVEGSPTRTVVSFFSGNWQWLWITLVPLLVLAAGRLKGLRRQRRVAGFGDA